PLAAAHRSPCPPRPLLSFPTRRSSDLRRGLQLVGVLLAQLPLEHFSGDILRKLVTHHDPLGKPVAAQYGPRLCNQLFTADSGSRDRKSTRLNSSHVKISYAVFCSNTKT